VAVPRAWPKAIPSRFPGRVHLCTLRRVEYDIPTTEARLGIRELRGRLTSLVRRAGTGERIVITIAGRPVAQLGPVEPAGAEVSIDDLVARGLLEPARRGDRPTDPGARVDTWTGGRLDRALREVRGA
jgi:prevent-host-death family protein